nr:GNAT family N-acetyltransferase [Pontibacter liquoris]
MIDEGFIKIELPESCVIEHLNGQSEEEYVSALSQKNRRHFVQKIKRNQHYFDVQIKSSLPEDELAYAIRLFRNVKNNNFAINSFHFPEKLFRLINESKDWEFVVLTIKEEYASIRTPVAICFCHINADQVYSPMLIGMDYDYLMEFGIYRQTLFEVIKRANARGCRQVNFGISASIEKKRIGAVLYPKVGYYQAKDNFAMEMIGATYTIERE